MSVEVTRLPSGLTVVTDSMPHLQTASLGVWVGAGSRDEQPRRARHFASARAHGVQGHQAPHRAPDRRGDRGGRRRPQRRDQRRDHGLFRPRAQGRRAAGARRAVRHPVRIRPSIRTNSSASRTSSCRRSAPPKTRPTIWCSTICRRPRFPNQPIGRSILGTPETVRSFNAQAACAPISRAIIARPTWWSRRPARSITQQIVAEVERRFASFVGPAAPQPQPANFGGGTQARGARPRAGAHRAGAGRRAAARSPTISACRCSPSCSAAACRRGCSRRCARSAASATRSRRSMRPMPTPACSASMPAPTPATCRS